MCDNDSGEMTAEGSTFGSWSVKPVGRKVSEENMVKTREKEGGGPRLRPGKRASKLVGWRSRRGLPAGSVQEDDANLLNGTLAQVVFGAAASLCLALCYTLAAVYSWGF